MKNMRVLEIGGGDKPKYCKKYGNGINIDIRPMPTVDVVHDLNKPLPFSDGEFDHIYSSYLIEHLSWRTVEAFVREIHRILKHSGKALLITANLKEQARIIASREKWNGDESCLIFGDQGFQHNFHKCGFSPEYAVRLFKEAGFASVDIKPHPRCTTDMIIQAFKGIVDRKQWILNHCRVGEKILHVGSANNWVFQGSPLEPYVTCIDIDLYDFPNFKRLDAHDLISEKKSGFKDKSFDVAVVSEILEHVENPIKVLKGAYRIAKRVLITVPNPANWIVEYRPYETLPEAVKRTGKTPEELARKDNPDAVEFYTKDDYSHLFHRRWYTKEMLEKDLEKAGIKDYELNRLAYEGWSFFVVEAPKPILKTSKKRRKKYLKIGLIAAPFLKVPPKTYGGSEMIIADLAEVLAQMGHEVTVFAADGSRVKGCEVVEFGPPIRKVQVNWLEAERNAYQVYRDLLKQFDIIHSHDWFSFCYASKVSNPQLKIMHTHHGGLSLSWWKRSPAPFKLNLVAISKWMKTVYEKQEFTAKYVYNGVNIEKYPFKAKKGKRLLYVGRFSIFKQPHVAIEIAKKLNTPIDLVGGSFVDDPNYLERIKGMCNNDEIKMYLDAPHETKIDLMRNAKCLLFPSRMGEPFGLVAVEAMVCGTPVVALNDGAISEVVKEGGFVSVDSEGMIDSLKQIHRVKPRACRRNAKKFSREIMAGNYLKLYEQILAGKEW